LRIIIPTVTFEGDNREVLHKPTFMFGDVAPDSIQQLLAREDQWLFKIGKDKYYLLSSMHHFPLSFSGQ